MQLPKVFSNTDVNNIKVGDEILLDYKNDCIDLEEANEIYATFLLLDDEENTIFTGYITPFKDGTDIYGELYHSNYELIAIKYKLIDKEEVIVEGCQAPYQSETPVIILEVKEEEKTTQGNTVTFYKWKELITLEKRKKNK
jgi:hypothetical protein